MTGVAFLICVVTCVTTIRRDGLQRWSYHPCVDQSNLEGAAEQALQSSGADGSSAVSMVVVARHVLGSTDAVQRVPASALPRSATATLSTLAGQVRIYVRRGLTPVEERFAIAHELGHHILDHRREERSPVLELEADYAGACMVIPRRALRDARRELGDDIAGLAEVFQASQTAVALRLGEAGALPAVIVVSPKLVRVRSLCEVSLPSEPDIRRLATGRIRDLRRTAGPGIRRARLTDDRQRIALLLDDDAVA